MFCKSFPASYSWKTRHILELLENGERFVGQTRVAGGQGGGPRAHSCHLTPAGLSPGCACFTASRMCPAGPHLSRVRWVSTAASSGAHRTPTRAAHPPASEPVQRHLPSWTQAGPQLSAEQEETRKFHADVATRECLEHTGQPRKHGGGVGTRGAIRRVPSPPAHGQKITELRSECRVAR